MNVLVLVTDSYPYGTAETFVHNEIGFADGFDRVFILPVAGSAKDAQTRAPAFATVVPGESGGVPGRLAQLAALNGRALSEISHQLTRPRAAARVSSVLYAEAIIRGARPALARVVKEVSALAPDRVVVYSYWFYTPALAAVELAQQLRQRCREVACVSRAHGFDLYEERTGIGYLPYREYLLTHLDGVYCCSQQGTDYLQRKHPRFAGKVATAYLGVKDQWNGQLPQRGKPFHIATCANISPVKRLNLWIKALATITDREIVWTHLGAGPQFGAVREFAAGRLPANIRAEFPGSQDNAEVFRRYNRGDISLFVNTSASEGLPVSIMEAFSCGIPAVAPKVGGIPEIVTDGVNGYLFDVDASPETIAALVRRVMELENDEYTELCRAARRTFEEKFCDSRNYSEFYRKLLK